MLGKGLESLIPNKNPNQGNGGSSASPNPGNSQDNSRQPSSAPYNPKNSQPSQDGPVFLPIQDLASEDFLPEEPGADELLEDGVEEDELLEDGSKEEHEGKTDPQPAKTRPAPQQQPAASSTMPSQAVRSEEKPEEKKVYVPRQESFQQTRQSSPASHDHSEKPYEAVFHIEVEKIKPNPQQPRRDFNQDAIKELAASIREFGILQPLVVTKVVKEVPTGTDVEYYLIAGERRLRAAKYLGLERVPAVIKNVDLEKERLELAIIENLQRENLNPVEMGRAFARLQDEFRLTQREIAARLGKSREAVANTMRLLDLPP
jgi:ParB/RepB/Spo0J family partition protein